MIGVIKDNSIAIQKSFTEDGGIHSISDEAREEIITSNIRCETIALIYDKIINSNIRSETIKLNHN